MEYKYSYFGFVLWLLSFVIIGFMLPILPIENINLITRITLNYFVLQISVLMYIIYKNESIYWFNGITYKDALNAGSQRRKAFAYKHLKSFGLFFLIFFFISIVFHVFHFSYFFDIIVATIGLIVTALSTNKYKL